ncbi:RNA polymerase sigma-70 factor [Pseudonocardia endophytica]|uniref:RNA polymerase sigma-70 factor (ECF subfamily) n=1 Tax=Pseudonocardia endophytica TaxID=401976 RepID=A0A4R1HUE0_PSEEN|nr:RNA polymerase sigma-70 factor [Pseudonocardia endophytica]TCK26314.1 RNA polymerase sigma-70 factor (ECF subfamily) [Pseudonocardia endophytica]
MTTAPDLEALRPVAFAVAYRMVGSVSEAEDIVQETLVRLHRSHAEEIRCWEAYATTIATRLSLNQLRSARVRREHYVGTWLPEPLLDVPAPATPDGAAETADSISMAFLVLLETLSPAERAAFLLREVFGYDYPSVAEMLERTPTACRQLVTRARRHVEAGRPRFEVDDKQREQVTTRFLTACRTGDLDELTDLLTADAVFTGDGGGNVPPGIAITRPVHGRPAVARLLLSFHRRGAGLRFDPVAVNGQPGLRLQTTEGLLVAVLSLDIVDGRVQAIRSVVNPAKLGHLGPTADLDRLRTATPITPPEATP